MADTDKLDDPADRYLVPALERGLRLLGEFSRSERELSPPELARRLQLPRTTVFRLIATLESLGFVERSADGRSVRLGLAVLRLGFEFLASLELTQLGQPILARLSEAVRMPCNLVVRDGRHIVYVAKVNPPTPLSSSVSVGTRLPAHATVLGRVLLADLALGELRALYPEDRLERFSASTPQTVRELFDLVQADRERGHVAGEGFFESNISTIAAPVRDHSGRVVAALGATLNSPQIVPERASSLLAQVRAAADELSHQLNYTPTRSGAVVLPLRRS
jgi:DNA-binding IclR family transcriptional regulator